MGTSSTELIHFVNSLKIPNFLGVFDKHFPGFLDTSRVGCAIVNTGDVSSGGVHWIAFAFDPVSYTFYMFDPFGWSKKELFRIYKFQYDRMLKQTAMNTPSRCVRLVKSVEAVQCICSGACGLYCVLFLTSFTYYRFSPMCNNPIIDIVEGVPVNILNTRYGIYVTHCNQQNLYAWFYVNSSYFRNNARIITHNTGINIIQAH
ncbi:protease [Raptor adenovirus 1]|uniref:Protease n=1 Tax=Raptor adenovirus 1 TaxID=1520002 RepID=B6SBN1_9ADEN|nr:protease [Raptor adenovirus 1]ACH89475.1 protease [Raptor adenovirus 1]